MHSKPGLKSIILLLLLMVSPVMVPPAHAVELLGNWIYRESGGDGLETQSEFQQRYQLGVGPAVTYQLTPAITASGGVGYRQTQRDSGDGFETVEQVSPFGNISLVNDIFVASASANTFTTMSGSDNSSAYWNASLNSAWNIPFWPTIQLNYGEDFSGVDNKSLFDDSNGKNQNTTASIDWDLLLANLYYEYNINEFIDGSGESLSKATTHYGRFATNGRFWSDRIGYNLTQQYRETTTDFGSGGLEEDADGFFRIPVEGLVSYLRTTTALAPDPGIEDVNLTNKPELSDRILDDIDTNSVPPVEPLQTGHFGFTPFDTQPLNRLFLYLDRFSANQFNPDELPGLTWQIYTKDPIDTFWSPEIPDVPFTYNTDLGRFELSFATISGPEFLVVVTNPSSGTELVFTELEAFRLAATEDGTTISEVKSTSYQTNIGARYRITETLMSSFTFNYDHGDDKNGGDTVREYDRTTWSGRMSWSPVPYVTPSIGYSENREENTGQDDRLNRLYSVTVSTRPLPSVNFSLGYTHNDRYEDKDKTYKADTYSLFAKASIYPDLSVSLNNSYSVTDTLDRNSAEESFINNKTLTSRLDITARLHRYLTAFGTGNYSTTDNEETGERDSASTTLTLSFRPSDLLSLSSSYSAFFLDDERSDAFTASMELYLLRTNKSRVSLLANHIEADETSDSFRVIGSWDISDYFSFTGNGSYNMNATRDTYAFYLSLAMRL